MRERLVNEVLCRCENHRWVQPVQQPAALAHVVGDVEDGDEQTRAEDGEHASLKRAADLAAVVA